MDREYIAFISYRHAPLDSAVAKSVHSLIEQYCIPRGLRRNEKKKFGYVFRDQEELPVSSDLSEDIRQALDRAAYLIVICSPETKKSPWVTREIAYFLQHHDRSRVFAVLAAGEPAEVFPESLTQAVQADGTPVQVEPLALDTRADSPGARKKKLRREILRLYAAMLGCPYDKLVLRSQRRRRRQVTGAAAVILAAALSFSGLLLVKNRQIRNQNEDLARQQQALLLRESELLTRDAQEALDRGAYASAVESAVAALPAEGEDRPYYAPAEAALIEALGLFDDNRANYMIAETILPNAAPVVDLQIRGDGTMLAAADRYNVVTCFDTVTGAECWSRQLDTDPVDDAQLLACGADMLLGIRRGGVTALSWQDGSVLWQYKNDFLADLPGVLSHDGAYLAVLDWRMTQDLSRYEFYLQVLATADGQQLYRIKLAEGMAVRATEEMPYVSFEGVLGDFSEDSSAFAGTYVWEDVSGQTYITYYRADLAEGIAQDVFTCEMGEDYREPVQVQFGKRECTVVYRQEVSKRALTVETVDCYSGTRLWQVQTPEESRLFDSGDPVICLRRDDLMYMTREDKLYVLDLTDGSPVHERGMEENILAAQLVGDRFLTFLLADGRYCMGWHNENGVYHSAEVFDTALELGGGEKVAFWGDALLQMTQDGNQYTGAVIVPGGYLVVLPEEEASSVSLRWMVPLEDQTEPQVTQILPEGTELSSGSAVLLAGDAVAFGMAQMEDTTAILLAGCQRQLMRKVSSHTMEDQVILPDGSGYISCIGWEEDLALYDGDGGVTVLEEQYSEVLYEADGICYGAGHWAFDTRYWTDGTVVAAACDGERLRLWNNGELWKDTTVPETVNFALSVNTEYRRTLVICGEYVLVSHFENADDLSMDAVAVYDISADTWSRIDCVDLSLEEAVLIPGSTNKVFALLDDDQTFHICNIDGTRIVSFAAPVPHGAVNRVDFILEDRYLLVKTLDQQVMILDSTTGEVLFRQRMEGYALSRVQAFADPVNNRLYLCDSQSADDDGLCLDMGSWTVLARIPGLLCYDPEQDVIYRYAGAEAGILRCRLPGTGELVSYCRAAFGLDAKA